MSLSLPSLTSASSGVSVSAPLVSSSFSSASSSSSFLDFAAYQASVLGLSSEYQALARWYFKSGGSDFLAYLSAFYPHLSADASRDFSSGSLLFLSALCSIASSLSLPSASLPPPGLAPPVSSVAPVFPQPPAPPPLPQPFPSSPGDPPAPPPSLSPALGWGVSVVRSTVGVSFAPLGVLSALPLSLCLLLLCLLSLRLLLSSLHLLLLSLRGVLWVCVLWLRWLVLLWRILWTLQWLRILRVLSFAPFLCLSLRPSL